MWSDLLQEELRRALLKSNISGNNKKGMKTKEENVALPSKGPSQAQGEQKKDLSKVK